MNKETRISEIQIIPIKPKNGLVAFASFVIDDNFYIGSVAIFTRPNGAGFRLVYPTKSVGVINSPIFHPINVEAGLAIEQAVIGKFNELFNEIYPS